MRKSIFIIPLTFLSFVGCHSLKDKGNVNPSPTNREPSIVILFESDVHCRIDRYPVFAGYRDAVADTAMTATVSCGDFLQGSTAGAISKGQYCIDIMKEVGYDAVTLGNHEFDYKIPHMMELLSQLGDSVVVDANLVDIQSGKNLYAPYLIKDFGKYKVAFMGVTTPNTLNTETYAFYDGASNQTYDLMNLDFFTTMQHHIDSARAEGADYVVVLSHLGEDPTPMDVDSHTFIAATTGIDALLDGHTHNVVQPMTLPNKDGKPIWIAQTGSELENIGKMVIAPDGQISIELVPTSELNIRSQIVQKAVDSVMADMEEVISRPICNSVVDLRVSDGKGDDIGRRQECNAGDLICDAFRITTGSDIAVINAGAIRNDLNKGEVTYGDIINMLPYDNNLCIIQVTGDTILEMLQANIQSLPYNDGQFPQVSGLKFTASCSDHSISDVWILDEDTGDYKPLDPEKNYTFTSTDYCIYNGGLRDTLKNSILINDAFSNYRDQLILYLTDYLQGTISDEYASPDGRITILRE